MLLSACNHAGSGPCRDVTCGDHGVCVDAGGVAACLCDPGYVPYDLACITDPCTSSPCVYGTCRADGPNALCRCAPGYAGPACDRCAPGYHIEELACLPGSPCADDPCIHGLCREVDGTAVCDCDSGYAGALCDQCAAGYHPAGLRCVSDTPCDPDPCVHGSCYPADDGTAGCNCDPGYAGDFCDACAPGYHQEGLQCVPDVTGPCDPNPCTEAHRSVCVPDGDAYSCACDPGYQDNDDNGSCRAACPAGLDCPAGQTCDDSSGTAACVGNPCDPNPCTGEHKTVCLPAEEGYTCACDPGYQDNDDNGSCRADCATAGLACPDGQVCDDSSGEASCVGDPCDPNPCTTEHRTVCTPGGPDGYVCACDPGYQDNDEDGTCLAGCATSGLQCPPGEMCDDSSGLAVCVALTCPVTVTYDPGEESITALYLRGEPNDWGLDHPFQSGPDGTFTLALQLAPGNYAYKLYDQGRDRWFEDPANPYFAWIDGVRNSRLRVFDCRRPRLELVDQPEVSGDTIAFQVRVTDGVLAAGIDPTACRATHNHQEIAGAYDPATGMFTVDDGGLAPGKHTYRFRAADSEGRTAELLYVPLWLEQTPFAWEDAVLYFVLTDRFADGDPSNNSPAGGVDPRANWQGGDFAGLEARITSGYFDDLGVDALWISSVTLNTAGAGAGTDGRMYSAYHSYWPIGTGWREDAPLPGLEPVDPHFGDLEDLRSLVQTAHDHGIRVLVDFVANHVHSDGPLWVAHQADDPPWFHDLYVCGWDQPINCWFADYLPDFEYTNLQVLETVVEHAVWLVQQTDVDGFRLDAVKHMIDDFSFAVRARIEERVATTGLRFYMVGETFTGEGQGAADLIKHYVRPSMLDGQFDFPLYWQVVKTFLREEQDFRGLESMLQWNLGYYGDFAVMSNFLGNHDVPRALSHAAGDIADMWGNGAKEQGWVSPPVLPGDELPYRRLRLAWTFLMTVPGIPLIYYGDEFGMAGAGDPDNRRFMTDPADLSPQQQATLSRVQTLSAVRHAHPCLRRGQRTRLHMDPDGLVWAYGMQQGADRAVVVFNRRAAPANCDVPVGDIGLSDGETLTDAIHGTAVTVTNGTVGVTLESRDAAVLVTE